MIKWFLDWTAGRDKSWINQVKATESGQWLTPQELLGVQTQGDADIAKVLIEKRKREGYKPFWWIEKEG